MTESQSILDSLRRIVRALRLNSTQIEKDLGVTGAQFFILQKLETDEWVSISELARRTSTDQSSVSVVLKKMLEEKLILKKTHPTDRRSALISLSLIGQKYAKAAKPLVQNQLLKGISKLPKHKQEELSKLLQELLKHSELSLESPALFFEEGKRRAYTKRKVPSPKST